MAQDKCNLDDKRELDLLLSLKQKGIDGKRMLRDTGEFDPATGKLRVGNIRIDKFNVNDDVKDTLAELIKEGDYFIEQRRGTMSFKRTEELAMEIKPSIKLKPGETLNAEELQSLANAVAGLSIRATEASQAAAENATEENIIKARVARQEALFALAALSGAKSEAGRALSIQRNMINALAGRDAKLIREALKRGKDRFTVEQITALVSKIDPDDVHAQYRFLQALRKPQMGDYLMELWYNSILSGPLTHMRNFVGNTSHMLFEVSTHPAAVLYDYVHSVRTGEPRSIYLGEISGSLWAAFASMPQGLKRGLFVMKNGYSIEEAVKLEIRKTESFKGKFGAILNSPRRMLVMADSIARSMFMSYDMYGRAYTTAKNEKLTGKRFQDRIAGLLASPDIDMLQGAQEYARRGVFQQEGGRFIQGMSKIRTGIDIKGVQPIAFVIPFIETPANIYKVGFRASPLGFFGKSKVPRNAARDFGRALLGSLVMSVLAMFAAAGRLTGSGPSDKEKRDHLYRIGWQPDSVKIGDKWYSYKNISPLNTVFSWVGNMMDGYIYDNVLPDTQGITTLLVRNAESMLDQSFFSGVNGFISAMTGEEYERTKFFNRFATSVIPQAIQQTVRIFDPTLYQTVDLGSSMKAALGITDGLPVRYDVFGVPIERQRAGGLPVFPSQQEISPLEQKLINLGVQYLSPPPDKVGQRKMTPAEYANFSREVGVRLASQLADDSVLRNDLDPLTAQDKVDDIRAKIFKDVRKEMFPDLKGSDAVFRYSDDEIVSPNGFLDTVVLNAKALGVDPATALQRMVTGQKIRYITHGTIVVERLDVEDSERIKRELGSTPEMRLDHTIPLQLGGGNGRTNLKLVSEEQWKSFTEAENHLGNLLRGGKIKKGKAQQLIKDFKAGKIEKEEILKLK